MLKEIKNMFMEMSKHLSGKKGLLLVGFIALGGAGLCNSLIPYITMNLLDKGVLLGKIQLIYRYILVLIVLGMCNSLTTVLANYIFTKISSEMTYEIRMRCVDKLFKNQGDFYVNKTSGEIFTVLYSDIENVQSLFINSFFRVLTGTITAVFMFIILFDLQPDIMIIIIIGQLLVVFIQLFFNKKINIQAEVIRHVSSDRNSKAQELTHNLYQLILQNLSKYLLKTYRKKEEVFIKERKKYTLISSSNSSIINFVNIIIMSVVYGYGGYQVVHGTLSIGALISFNMYSQRFFGPMLNFIDFVTDIAETKVSWKRIYEILSLNEVDSGKVKFKDQTDIEFRNVDFSYEKNHSIYKKMNLKIHPQKVNAIVGKSGAGKTTLINLLYRIWNPIDGAIYIGSRKIEEYDIESLRDAISIVSQNVLLLNDTLYNNLLLGDNTISINKVIEVLVRVDLYDFMNSLPNKLNTVIGENGIKLSGGERQRLAIGRALLKDTPIIIFDEATSMLDNKTEQTIMNTIDSISDGKTIIVIAHRLTTIENADIIHVLRDGKLSEAGSHKKLMQNHGEYYSLYNKREF